MSKPGVLWLVATPIGNLGDLPPRALEVLRSVAAIAAEDTRHARPLLQRFGVSTPLLAYHEHNERTQAPQLLARLLAGESLALISDAGTPLLSDPGFQLVSGARAAGVPVSAVPGPCAAIVALSVSGLPSDRFVFEGFLPSKRGARRAHLAALAQETRTLVCYEAKHRIVETLLDLAEAFGSERRAAIARELTKLHETVLWGSLAELGARVQADAEQQLGEFVLVVEGAPAMDAEVRVEREGARVLHLLMAELPASRAARLAAEITGAPRNALYRLATGGD